MSRAHAMRHTLRLSLRRDSDDLTLEQIRDTVQSALGCQLMPGGERYDMFLVARVRRWPMARSEEILAESAYHPETESPGDRDPGER